MKPDEFITADTHWGHSMLVKNRLRPFDTLAQMDETLVRAWNAKVPPRAIVYHLGDVGLCQRKRLEWILRRLNGQIRLIRGNHDKNIKGSLLGYFDWVKDYYESTTPDGIKVVMSHYPFLTWNKSHWGSYSLHGHSHGNLQVLPGLRMDVGVDTTSDWAPYSYEEIKAHMGQLKAGVFDHHVTGN
jgi:calcineurin-like phosphoesterase family protein